MKKRLLLLVMVVMMLVSLTACGKDPIQEAKESVVRIYAEYAYYDAQGNRITNFYLYEDGSLTPVTNTSGYIGSGFAVGDNPKEVRYFVTNRHVVEDSEIEYVTVEDYNAGQSTGSVITRRGFAILSSAYIVYETSQNMIPAKVQYVSEDADIALLYIHTPTNVRKPAKLRPFEDGELANRHEDVYVLGFPAAATRVVDMADSLTSTLDHMTVNNGIISNVTSRAESGYSEGELIQHNVDTNGGNSGGPLVDAKGYVLGVHTMSAANAKGIAYATSINEVVRMLDSERVPYLVGGGLDTAQLIGIIVLAVLIIAVVAVIVMSSLKQQKKPGSKRTITGVNGVLSGRSFDLKPGTVCVLGSDVSCNVQLSGAQGVSRRHCSVKFDGKTVVVRDENSTYGTFIEGVKIEKGQTATWHRGQKLSLGSENESVKLS
ncbi:MAG: trypsin-like peptidase domain-containing protein [Clostridia bacterium]|nr:trypsin-like peptidase domain-containing protein [Clostridia bacterium]